jgi:hypothetical protein
MTLHVRGVIVSSALYAENPSYVLVGESGFHWIEGQDAVCHDGDEVNAVLVRSSEDDIDLAPWRILELAVAK